MDVLENINVKKTSEKRLISDLMDEALEMQDHARKKYSVTLSIQECIGMSQANDLNESVRSIDKNVGMLADIVSSKMNKK